MNGDATQCCLKERQQLDTPRGMACGLGKGLNEAVQFEETQHRK